LIRLNESGQVSRYHSKLMTDRRPKRPPSSGGGELWGARVSTGWREGLRASRTRPSTNARALGAALLLCAAFAVPSPALADEVKDGAALADRLCAQCHVVSREVGPAFIDIAEGPHASRGALSDFLRSTHSDVSHPNAMPAPELSPHEVDSLAAYIASLRAQ
jgi:mono/diheme cytochrome c family protein